MEQRSQSYTEVRSDQILAPAEQYEQFPAISWVLTLFFDGINSFPMFLVGFFLPSLWSPIPLISLYKFLNSKQNFCSLRTSITPTTDIQHSLSS